TVTATDNAGKTATASHTYQVLAGSTSANVAAGDTVTTDPGGVGATSDVPVQTAVTVPDGVSGTLSIALQDTSATSPTGYSLFGEQVQLDGPTASASTPYMVTFTVDASLLGSVAVSDTQMFRNGSPVPDCIDPTA